MIKLNKRIEIQKIIETVNKNGGIDTTFEKLYEVWANINPISTENNFELSRLEDKVTHIITTRYLKDINTKMRIIFKERIFQIKGIINLMEENKFLEFNVEEKF